MIREALANCTQPEGFFRPSNLCEEPQRFILPDDRESLCQMRDTYAPLDGRQELLWLDSEIGLVITDLAPGENVCVLEGAGQLSLQFRLEAASLESETSNRWSNRITNPCLLARSLPEGMSFYQKVESRTWRTVSLLIPATSLQRMLQQEMELISDKMHNFMTRLPHTYFQQQFSIAPRQYFILSDMLKCSPDTPMRNLYLGAKTFELLFSVLQNLFPDTPGPDTQGDVPPCPLSRQDIRNLQLARDLLVEQFDSPPTLQELARIVGINRRKLTQGFKFLFGVTVYEYCVGLRMEQARKLLVHDGESLSSVAWEVGYKSPSSFTKVFKRHFGFLPSDLRPVSVSLS